MAYIKFHSDWQNDVAGGTPVNEAALDYIEEGIYQAHVLAEAASSAVHTHVSAGITDATAFNVVGTVVKRDNEGGIAVTRVTGLSTAVSASAAVPKSQLDSGIATRAPTSHTHLAAEVSDASTLGRALMAAATATAARASLDVDATTEVDTKVAAGVATAAADATTKADAAKLAAATGTATAVNFAPIDQDFATGAIPVRPDTSGTNRKVYWFGPAAAALPTNGTAAGGTSAAAPGDRIFEN